MDRTRLARVFENLLENAIQHSPSGGVVTVEARAVREDKRAWIPVPLHGLRPGFAGDDLPWVFEPFFTRRAAGTGLGLALVARVVEEHAGTVSAANHPDGGTVMTVRLPPGRA
jgi:signal transduction histidine kinase